jgi:uncharacterized protein involved in exopolysaccharide biosynthesis
MDQEVVQPNGESEEEAGSQVSPAEFVAFLFTAAKRHIKLGVLIGLGVSTLGIAVAFVIPPRFDAETRILFDASAAVAPALSSPVQQRGNNLDPFGGATELIMQKSNLLRIVEDADLLNHYRSSRSLPQRIKDSILSPFVSPASDERMKISLAETLEKRMYSFHSDKLLTIHVGWSDAEKTLKIAQLAQKSYLDMRRSQELAVITAAMEINEGEVKRAAQGIDIALEEVVRVRERAKQAAIGAARTAGAAAASADAANARRQRAPSTASSATPINSQLPEKNLTAQLAEVRKRAQEVETPWQRRLADLKFQLNDLRGTFGPEHPNVLQQEAKIREGTLIPPELVQLRNEERQLLAQLESATAAVTTAVKEPSQTTRIINGGNALPRTASAKLLASNATLVIAERDDDPLVAPARANLTAAIQRYNEATTRFDTARLELTSAQVALQYRYAVVGQPEKPLHPTRPNRPLLMLGAILAGAIFGFLSGALRDLLSGRVFEPWQAKSAGLTVLGTVSLANDQKT